MARRRRAKKKSDYSTIIGIIVGIALIFISIGMGDASSSFLNPQAFIIVVGGTLAVTVASFSWGDVSGLLKSIRSTVFTKIKDVKAAGVQVVSLSEHAKKKGLLSLSEKEDDIETGTLLHSGTQMLVDGATPEDIEKFLKQDIESTLERNDRAAAMLRKAAEIAPAMGLIGTLIGLVQMLGQLDDPAGIGPPMAVALLTTLYGAFFAYMVLTPLASKVERNSNEEFLLNKIYLTAIVSMGRQDHPRKLQTLLNTILPPSKKLDLFS